MTEVVLVYGAENKTWQETAWMSVGDPFCRTNAMILD